ncbi:hypothetical protein TRICI_005341 [Trichomonascus ciferrii]|uniref:Trafficking protein particle complex III-specific subunit 85 n=1 Tax=Trichomonascus ciferrii TaxID=44093 RepID=A0A642UZS0_9ASCO|nr:hypothetical protein TRICI_005341 [Trichomonascus ciferrii]
MTGERSACSIPTKCKQIISRSFCPTITVTPSLDTEELCRDIGFSGLLELIQPFGNQISGRVTIRDSQSLSVSFDDFAVRFSRPPSETEQIEVPELPMPSSPAFKSPSSTASSRFTPTLSNDSMSMMQNTPSASNKNVIPHQLFNIEEMESRLADEIKESEKKPEDMHNSKQKLYLDFITDLLSSPPVTPFETFGHPVAGVIAISSKNQDPIETLSTLYKQSHDPSIPDYINKDYLRYYVLIHDEKNDDISKSVALFEKMKRNFGLHCHMIRLNRPKEQEADDSNKMHEEDTNALRIFTRELITQSVIPFMERCIATWNDQVASTRRGITGRFFSASRKYFASSTKATSSILSSANTGSFPFSLPGTPTSSASTSPSPTPPAAQPHYNRGSGGGITYAYLTPEAQLRKLADFAFMLRDYKFAYMTYDMLKKDFHNEKAWAYLAGVQEMAAVSYLMYTSTDNQQTPSYIRLQRASGPSIDVLEPLLDSATYTYISRCSLPTYALRCIVLCSELLCSSTSPSAVSGFATRWILKALNEKLVGRLAYAMLMERVSGAYSVYDELVPKGSHSTRRRKAAFWMLLAAREWTDAEQYTQSEFCLDQSDVIYSDFTWAKDPTGLLDRLRRTNQRSSVTQNLSGLNISTSNDP